MSDEYANRALEQLTTMTMPAGFTPITDSLPKEDEPVLAIRVSGYISSKFEIITARHMPTYRRLSPWRDLSGDSVHDSVHDSGEPVLGWKYAPELLG